MAHPDADEADEPDEGAAWRAERRRAAAVHGAAHERRRAAEAAQGRELVAEFVQAARERGLRDTALTARAYTGAGGYRTGLRGWYLRRDRSVAVGTDGGFYILTVPASLRARLTGARVAASDPPLVVGQGGRDGESMPLRELLRQRLAAGDEWP